MRKTALLLLIGLLSGCATHAEIKMPVVSQVQNASYQNKTLSYDILYSQPQPGIFTEGEQQSLTPLEDAELSVASASTLRDFPELMLEQLPASVNYAENSADLKLHVQIIAHDKKGPAYSDYEFGKSLGKGIASLGFASDEYDIIADFDAKYTIEQDNKKIFSKNYEVKETEDHQEGQFDLSNELDDITSQILEKHIILTLNDFFSEAADYIDP